MPQVSDTAGGRISPARRAALTHLSERVRCYPDLFPRSVDTTGLDDRDARLAIAIDRAVTIRWLTLRAVPEPMLTQPWNKQHHAVKTALLAGAAQLLLLDRVPDHAAIDQSVQWCRQTPAGKAAGAVNAVLRRVTRLRGERLTTASAEAPDQILRSDGSGWMLHEPVFDGEPADRMARQTGCGRHFFDRVVATRGQDEATRLALHSMADPPIILRGAGESDLLVPHAQSGYQTLLPGASLKRVLRQFPEAIVQDPTAAAAVQSTACLSPELIVDFCAGRGTKTRQLADLHPDATVIASDVSDQHLNALRSLQHPRVDTVEQSSLMQYAGRVNLLVLDVPCTNSGVLARRIEARHRQRAGLRSQLRDLQRQIAADALALLAPGGTILWSTCSIDPEENEGQIEWLTQWHDLEVDAASLEPGWGPPGGDPGNWRDGGYFARLRKRSDQTI